MPRYLLTDAAKTDIREIIAYIRQRNPSAARRVRQELRSAMQKLATFPRMGHFRADIADEAMRSWAVFFVCDRLSARTSSDPNRARAAWRA